MNTALGGGFTSLLVDAIRVDRGLSYSVSTRLYMNRRAGLSVFSSFTSNESLRELVDVALEKMREYAAAGPSEDAVEKARRYLAGLFPLGLESHEALAEQVADALLDGAWPRAPGQVPQPHLGGDGGRGARDRGRALPGARRSAAHRGGRRGERPASAGGVVPDGGAAVGGVRVGARAPRLRNQTPHLRRPRQIGKTRNHAFEGGRVASGRSNVEAPRMARARPPQRTGPS